MQKKKRKPIINSVPYDKQQIFWGVMYKKQVTQFLPRGRDAQKIANINNKQWTESGWKKEWSVKRFKFKLKGEMVDIFTHTTEQRLLTTNNPKG